MKITGVVCEYNPFHNGHARQIPLMKADGAAVCLMSGNYVQRGEPAICDKLYRAEAAVRCGADLVLELPITYALRSAEGFADGGVEIFERLGCVDRLSFGSECGDENALRKTARLLLSVEFSLRLKEQLEAGISFPRARQEAVNAMGMDGAILREPNDILGIEYCKALEKRNSTMELLVVRRQGSYHESKLQSAPSASMLRDRGDWAGYMPKAALNIQSSAVKHSLRAGERAVLARLRGMAEKEFAGLPFGSEGLWRKLMQACRCENSLEEIIAETKSKRYTHSRLMRMIMCAFLGIDETLLNSPAPYVRVLAMNECGGKLLRQMRERGSVELLNIGERAPYGRYSGLEERSQALYGLFAVGQMEAAEREEKLRFCAEFD